MDMFRPRARRWAAAGRCGATVVPPAVVVTFANPVSCQHDSFAEHGVKVAHFDCFSGISGDMVLGAVLDAGVPPDAIRRALDSLGLPITLEVERVKRCGFEATKATISAP